MSEIKYKHTQIGYVTMITLGTSFIIIARHMVNNGFNLFGFVLALFMAGCFVLFPTLTVSIGEKKLNLYFGVGFISSTINMEDVESCFITKSRWFEGWGIKKIHNGWMYNVSGFKAVELTMKDGTVYRIGTDRPVKLEKKIKSVMDASESPKELS